MCGREHSSWYDEFMVRKPNNARLTPYAITIGIYAFYLILLPIMTTRLVPCLSLRFGTSYTDSECNLKLVLDRFLILALLGLAVGIFSLFYIRRRRTIVHLLLTGGVCALLAVSAFHLYLPYAEGIMQRAPIVLESLR
jgi:hypothetical protein